MPTADTPTTEQGRLLATLERLLAIQAWEVKSALDEAAQLVTEVLGADKADVFLNDPSSDTLVALATSATPLGQKQQRLGLNRLPIANGGQATEVFHQGASYYSGHVEDDLAVPRGIREGLGVRSLIDVALDVGGVRRGVFEVAATRPEAFSLEDLRFCEAVARWVGLVAHRAALVERATEETAVQAQRVTTDERITVRARDLQHRQKLTGNQWLDSAFGDDHEAELGFMVRLLVQATIPHRRPGPVPAWGRRNGALSFVVQPGWVIGADGQPRSIGLPYGPIPRLLLAWVTTEAVRTKERDLTLGESLSEFMCKLGLVPTDGRWGSNSRLHEQLRRLFSATIAVSYEQPDMVADAGCHIADKAILFWDPKSPEQAALWKSTVTLSERFFAEIVHRPVPLDLTVLKGLTRWPMSIDIYIWLTYRMSYLTRSTTVPWGALELQFGVDYARTGDFRRKFLAALNKVLLIYPAAVAIAPEGLLLAPGSTRIPHRTECPR